MAHYREWVGGGGEGEDRGGLNPPLALFGLAMSPKSVSHRPNKLEWHKRRLPVSGTQAFHVAPSIILAVNLQGQQNSL